MLEHILKDDPVYRQLKDDVEDYCGPVLVSGCTDTAKWHLTSLIGNHKKKQFKIIIVPDENKARQWVEASHFFGEKVQYIPAKDPLFYTADVHGNAIARDRMLAIKKIVDDKCGTFVMTIDAVMDQVVPLSDIKNHKMTFKMGETLEEATIAEEFVARGYEKAPFVEAPGEFTVRGGIIDIFPYTQESPYRIELWGDEIDSIRSFDKESQRSIEEVDTLTIYPASEIILNQPRIEHGLRNMEEDYEKLSQKFKKEKKYDQEARLRKEMDRVREELRELHMLIGVEGYLPYFYENTECILDYFPEESMIYMDEPKHIRERADAFYLEFSESMKSRLEGGYLLPKQANTVTDYESILYQIEKHKMLCYSILSAEINDFRVARTLFMDTKSIQSYNNSFEQLVKDLTKYQSKDYRIVVASPSVTRAKRLSSDLRENGLVVTYDKDLKYGVEAGQIVVTAGKLLTGIEYPAAKWVLISEGDIFKGREEKKRRKKEKKKQGEKIRSFADINIGDYVVHEKHGVGIYRGIEKITTDGVEKDYISIEYQGGDNLFILASALDQIAKYASANARKPKLHKLGGNEWKKTKTRVKGQVKDIAEELVQLYALRQAKEGYVYDKDTVWQKEFEELFPYDETQDQLNAIDDTKRDMESKKIMDRLICGDVGYGKTEVAIRAAFKAVDNGKQVAYLVPTTILAQQHYNTFAQRFHDYPITVRMMSRFCTAKEQKETIEGLKNGTVDVVIGTHRLLSKDMQYKNLGLLVIDEEQRFGVTHKEKIKTMKKDVDVLSLSATPIPRTLHMSLAGIRDMSVLEVPPVDRRAIQTYVMEYNEELVREAIERELGRGGQVYYVYNRVNNIDEVAAQLQKLLPDATVEYAHGQMGERQLESIMTGFINKEIDVLVSTTIIETGLDIPNVNTMIIQDAQLFGLSQLYQLRGRVGRSNRTAYAFLMYRRNSVLKEEAEKRLKAIREFTDLGSGFKIAMRDLEIRGAGNLLGAEQSGHMESVGYDLYCKMLNEAVLTMKGEQQEVDTFTTSIDLSINAYIPETYIKSEAEKLSWYKRIAAIETEEEYEDMIEELTDRYGDPPKPLLSLMDVALLREEAHQAWLLSIEQKGSKILFTMNPRAKVRVEEIDDFLKQYRNKMKIKPEANPVFVFESEGTLKKELLAKVREIIKNIHKLEK